MDQAFALWSIGLQCFLPFYPVTFAPGNSSLWVGFLQGIDGPGATSITFQLTKLQPGRPPQQAVSLVSLQIVPVLDQSSAFPTRAQFDVWNQSGAPLLVQGTLLASSLVYGTETLTGCSFWAASTPTGISVAHIKPPSNILAQDLTAVLFEKALLSKGRNVCIDGYLASYVTGPSVYNTATNINTSLLKATIFTRIDSSGSARFQHQIRSEFLARGSLPQPYVAAYASGSICPSSSAPVPCPRACTGVAPQSGIMSSLQSSGFDTVQLPVVCTSGNPNCVPGGNDVVSPICDFSQPYFHVSPTTGALVMSADTNGVTTGHSFYARTELVHNRNWSLLSVGTASLTARLSIDALATQTGGGSSPPWLFYSPGFPRPAAIVIGQIKGLDGEIELRYEFGYVFLQIITSKTITGATRFLLLTTSDTNQPTSIPVGSVFQYTLEVITANNLIRATVVWNSITYVRSVDISGFYSFFSDTNQAYFKVGAYVQAHTNQSNSAGKYTPRVGVGSGQISLFSISTSFGDPVTPGLPSATTLPTVSTNAPSGCIADSMMDKSQNVYSPPVNALGVSCPSCCGTWKKAGLCIPGAFVLGQSFRTSWDKQKVLDICCVTCSTSITNVPLAISSCPGQSNCKCLGFSWAGDGATCLDCSTLPKPGIPIPSPSGGGATVCGNTKVEVSSESVILGNSNNPADPPDISLFSQPTPTISYQANTLVRECDPGHGIIPNDGPNVCDEMSMSGSFRFFWQASTCSVTFNSVGSGPFDTMWSMGREMLSLLLRNGTQPVFYSNDRTRYADCTFCTANCYLPLSLRTSPAMINLLCLAKCHIGSSRWNSGFYKLPTSLTISSFRYSLSPGGPNGQQPALEGEEAYATLSMNIKCPDAVAPPPSCSVPNGIAHSWLAYAAGLASGSSALSSASAVVGTVSAFCLPSQPSDPQSPGQQGQQGSDYSDYSR